MKIRHTLTAGRPALVAYLTCGDPDLETTLELARLLATEGCDIIELGIPFSDPVAEGPVIEAAQLRALESGTSTEAVFDLVRRLRDGDAGQPPVTVPVVVTTYANTVFAHGIEAWARDASAVGVQGLILPDVPLEERDEFAIPLATSGIELIPLLGSTTPDRLSRIAAAAADTSFVQLVAPASEIAAQIALIRDAAPGLPVAAGCETLSAAEVLAAGADAIVTAGSLMELVAAHGRAAADALRGHIRGLLAQITAA
ncbi:MAG: tryptophan synthase subunit alpha [Bacillota bacterium]|nr:tryptophan synthase subunit alpha [Bacillota bacterium]